MLSENFFPSIQQGKPKKIWALKTCQKVKTSQHTDKET